MPRPIDHLVLAVRDLDAAADLYARLGFTVGTQNSHPWGTLNRLVQLGGPPGRAFLELVGLEPGFVKPRPDDPAASFATFIARYLAKREGFAMLVLASADAAADHAAFQAAGIGVPSTLHFERTGRRPDGSTVHVAFTLAFAASPATSEAGFFACQHHFPDNFWNADFQRHGNGVVGVGDVTLVAAAPARHAPFLGAFTGAEASPADGGGVLLETGGGRVRVVTPAALKAETGLAVSGEPARFAAVTFACTACEAVRAALRAGGVPFAEAGGRIVVAPDDAHGVLLMFEELPARERDAGAV